MINRHFSRINFDETTFNIFYTRILKVTFISTKICIFTINL